ncbi:MAG: hypothetical protein UR68_C0013G0008 [Candidatus Roizmanbacteria bacterium GW2011_GWA2_35_19]|uniref:Thioredoxin domain-containing protein n=2 Tax=Candidatus Roizmaniibacteriota TaxID=1752723 RepID=A0A0G0EBY2_9BACT|nr:MAG: hypothetical protein UR63_C0020G0010 [Candidatus Roizmanbacteria bacterium GW2011_GWC2_35_12]KKP72695.1 MAG: hypothetical protein UR68_C0013G0008 [Candidatus Roizmanbacteria bacterium GW2011_GWA2_35_19]
MILLIGFAFFAGLITILSPCILPILPIILSSTIGGKSTGKSRPIGVVIGFILSFTFFTLFLSTIVKVSGISSDILRTISVFVIAGMGISLLIPRFQLVIEGLFSKLSRLLPRGSAKPGFGPGLLIGLSLGLLWTPCVGPILASVISLAISGTVTLDAFIITLAYSLGTAIPMFLIILGGQTLLQKVPWLLANTSNIQKAFGFVMIITAIGIHFNIDRSFQTYIITTFPQYGIGLTKYEDNKIVQTELKKITQTKNIDINNFGKPLQQKGPLAPEIIPGGEWLNSKPLTLSELKGKVVLVDFWTYTCINCQRTFPYLKEWWKKYQDQGLVIIGVHSPEFEFEKNKNNLSQAINDFGLTYPIVQDNNFSTWRAYDNHYWPAKYLIDKDGFVRYSHFGEGKYEETEQKIQELLKETGREIDSLIKEEELDTQFFRRTPETYLGSNRTERRINYIDNIPLDNYYLNGKWNITEEYASSSKNSSLILNFSGKEVNLVMSPSEKISKVKIYLNGKLVDKNSTGRDVVDGMVILDAERLYNLILLPAPTNSATLKIEYLNEGIKSYAFTF